MLDPEQRFDIWNGYKERALRFFCDVDNDRCDFFTPYNQPEDKDAPAIRKLYNLLEIVSDFIDEHTAQLNAEYVAFDTERSNLQDSFTAWNFGLCPKLIREHVPYFDWEDVMKFKQHTQISYEDTRQAIELWRQSRKLAG